MIPHAGNTAVNPTPEPAPRARRPHEGLGLYVHIPFCETKCGYCDFYSVALKDRNTAPLVAAVIRELDNRLGRLGDPVRTVFIGGGTPTLLPIDQLTRLLACVAEHTGSVDEFTVEANPATVDDAKAELLVASGVGRVSMGAQSFVPAELAALERLHSPDDIAPSVATLRRAGVVRLNLDLIFGIPGQSLDTWAFSLRRAVELEPDHIACYGLTYEPGTRLTAQREAGRVRPCDEGIEADMYRLTVDLLGAAGYAQYEISNFARPGNECRHNLIYWRNEPYVGIGPSAAGCYGRPPRRYKNIPDVGGYVRGIRDDGHAEFESETIDTETLIDEIILMQLRLNEGVNMAAFRRRTGIDPVVLFGDTLKRLVDQGLLTMSDTSIALTDSGRLVANGVIVDLAAAVSLDVPA